MSAFNGRARVSTPLNEPIRGYAPGSPERASLKATLDRIAKTGDGYPPYNIEQRGEIFVANDASDAILVFKLSDNGDVAPTRVIKGPRSGVFAPTGVALGQSVYYAIGTGAAQAVVFQVAGLLYGAYGQKAFLGMVGVAAIGMVALLLLATFLPAPYLPGASAPRRPRTAHAGKVAWTQAIAPK